MASKASLENELRQIMLEHITDIAEGKMGTDALPVSASEIAIPVVDSEGNEKFILVKVSIPRGTRNGCGGYDPYDGYALAEAYKAEQESKAQERAVKKAMKDAEKRKRKETEVE